MIRMATNSTLLCIHRDPAQLSLLKESGYELATANNGSEGLRLFMSRPVDAVVLEYPTGLVDGVAIADEMKRVRPEIPIVALVDHLELLDGTLRSADAIVAKSDGAHFLWATLHFVLNVQPAQRHEAKMRSQTSILFKRRAGHEKQRSVIRIILSDYQLTIRTRLFRRKSGEAFGMAPYNLDPTPGLTPGLMTDS